eukprot:COSAG01_NODE_136_length_24438_cov_243.426711_2_plen_515_part_00
MRRECAQERIVEQQKQQLAEVQELRARVHEQEQLLRQTETELKHEQQLRCVEMAKEQQHVLAANVVAVEEWAPPSEGYARVLYQDNVPPARPTLPTPEYVRARTGDNGPQTRHANRTEVESATTISAKQQESRHEESEEALSTKRVENLEAATGTAVATTATTAAGPATDSSVSEASFSRREASLDAGELSGSSSFLTTRRSSIVGLSTDTDISDDKVERVEQLLQQNDGRVSRQDWLLHNIRTPDLALEERRLRRAEEGVPPDMEPQPEDDPEPEQDGSLKSYLATQQEINSFIEDPIDGTKLGIMKQCVNVSINSADARVDDAVDAICGQCCLPEPGTDAVVEICLSNQWTPAKFIAQGTDGAIHLTIAVESGRWWSAVAQSSEADIHLSIEDTAMQFRHNSRSTSRLDSTMMDQLKLYMKSCGLEAWHPHFVEHTCADPCVLCVRGGDRALPMPPPVSDFTCTVPQVDQNSTTAQGTHRKRAEVHGREGQHAAGPADDRPGAGGGAARQTP